MSCKRIITMAVLALVPALAWAGNSWLDQGSKLLKDIGGGSSGTAAALTTQEITAGLKQALEKGAMAVVDGRPCIHPRQQGPGNWN